MAGDGPVVGLEDVDLDAALEVFLEVRRDPRIQLEQATQAAQVFLEALGVDLLGLAGRLEHDHREFELLGLPAAKLCVGAGGEPCRHSPCDRGGRLDPVSLRQARRLGSNA